MKAMQGDAIALSILACALWLLAEFLVPHQPPVRVDAPAPMQVVSLKGTPIAVYDAKERELTVTEHAPRETLVCLRGDCRLVEAWLGK